MRMRGYALVAGALCASALWNANSDAQVLLVEALLVAAATAGVASGIRRHRPDRPGAWWLLLAGPWVVLLGAVAVEVAVALDAPPVVVEATAGLDVLGYALLALGLRRLISHASPDSTRASRFDPAVLMVATGFLGWGLVNPEFPHDGLPGLIERTSDIAQMVLAATCLLAALGVAGSVDRRGRRAAMWLVGSAGMLTAVQFLLPFVDRLVTIDLLADILLLIALLLLAGAATHPDMAAIRPGQGDRTSVQIRVLSLLMALASPPLVLLADRISGGQVQSDALLVSWGLLTVVIMHRMLVLTRDRERLVQTVLRQATHDDLTGVHNRRGLFEVLQQVFDRADRESHLVGVVYLDLDAFKPINDRYGHVMGDQVLQIVASRLVEEVATEGTVSRIGGDEFIVVLPGVVSRGALIDADQRLRAAVTQPIALEGLVVEVGVSSGLDLRPPGGHDALSSLGWADQAMYASKRLDTSLDRVLDVDAFPDVAY